MLQIWYSLITVASANCSSAVFSTSSTDTSSVAASADSSTVSSVVASTATSSTDALSCHFPVSFFLSDDYSPS
jgi:hypothetical protein